MTRYVGVVNAVNVWFDPLTVPDTVISDNPPPPPIESTSSLCVTGSAYILIGVKPSTLELAIKVGTEFSSR